MSFSPGGHERLEQPSQDTLGHSGSTLSSTTMRTVRPASAWSRSVRTATDPPSGIASAALRTRLTRICLMQSALARTRGRECSVATVTATFPPALSFSSMGTSPICPVVFWTLMFIAATCEALTQRPASSRFSMLREYRQRNGNVAHLPTGRLSAHAGSGSSGIGGLGIAPRPAVSEAGRGAPPRKSYCGWM